MYSVHDEISIYTDWYIVRNLLYRIRIQAVYGLNVGPGRSRIRVNFARIRATPCFKGLSNPFM